MIFVITNAHRHFMCACIYGNNNLIRETSFLCGCLSFRILLDVWAKSFKMTVITELIWHHVPLSTRVIQWSQLLFPLMKMTTLSIPSLDVVEVTMDASFGTRIMLSRWFVCLNMKWNCVISRIGNCYSDIVLGFFLVSWHSMRPCYLLASWYRYILHW